MSRASDDGRDDERDANDKKEIVGNEEVVTADAEVAIAGGYASTDPMDTILDATGPVSPQLNKVKELAKKMKDEITPRNVLNAKYVEQNFHMQREMALYEKKRGKEKKREGEAR